MSGLADVTWRRRFSVCMKREDIRVFLALILSGNGSGELPALLKIGHLLLRCINYT